MAVRCLAFVFLLAAVSQASARDLTIDDMVVPPGLSVARRDAELAAVRAFYGFWNTGDLALLDRAIAPSFTDHTLPPGRPEGPDGPAFASKSFRAAVPDLGVTIQKLVVEGDYGNRPSGVHGPFHRHLRQGHGRDQSIRFIATDLIKIGDGRNTDSWHIEDNLTLLQQMGLTYVGQ